MTTVHIFRRDYRIDDNPAFLKAILHANENNYNFIPIFIFTQE